MNIHLVAYRYCYNNIKVFSAILILLGIVSFTLFCVYDTVISFHRFILWYYIAVKLVALLLRMPFIVISNKPFVYALFTLIHSYQWMYITYVRFIITKFVKYIMIFFS